MNLFLFRSICCAPLILITNHTTIFRGRHNDNKGPLSIKKLVQLIFWLLLIGIECMYILVRLEYCRVIRHGTVYISRFRIFKNFLYQGGVKSTVSWVLEDLNPIGCGGGVRTNPPSALSATTLWGMHQPIPNFLTFSNLIPTFIW